MSKCHPRNTARPTTAIKQLDAQLNASSDDTSRWLRPAPPDGGSEAWAPSPMCRAEPQPGGAATTLERVTEKSLATADRGDRPVTFVNFTAKNAMPARYVLERADWAGAAALPFTPSQYPQPDLLHCFTRGLGMARTSDLAGASLEIEAIRPSALRLKKPTSPIGPTGRKSRL